MFGNNWQARWEHIGPLRVIIILTVVLLLSFLPHRTWAGEDAIQCKDIFIDPFAFVTDLASLHRAYAHDPRNLDLSNYALASKGRGRLRDQCQYSSCWAESTLSILESRARQRGEEVALSADYLIYLQLRDQARNALGAIKSGEGLLPLINQEYSAIAAERLIEVYGIMPESAWHPKIELKQSRLAAQRMIFNFNAYVARLRAQIEGAMNPNDHTNQSQRKKEAIAWAYREIELFLQHFLGQVPEKFDFRGQKMTAETFSELPIFAPLETSNYSMIVPRADPQLALDAVIHQLDRTQEPVRINIQFEPMFMDPSLGLMSVEAFNPLNLSLVDIFKLASRFSQSRGIRNHLLNIIDYQKGINIDNGMFLLQDSYGEAQGGARGYWHMDMSYFKTFGLYVRVLQPLTAHP